MNTAAPSLPQQDGGWFLTDGGIETVLIYQDGIALPEFSAFVLLDSKEGRAALRRYFRRSGVTSTLRRRLPTPASSSRARPGVRGSLGARSSASTPPRCGASTATRSR
jgi:hypothetical protein